MGFWNRQKVKELELEISHKESEIESLRNQLQLAEKKIKGERVCDGYCWECAHAIEGMRHLIGGCYTSYTCELDCKCKDFQRKDAERVGEDG